MPSLYCFPCNLKMRCLKNDVAVNHNHAFVSAGDAFQCPQCGSIVINTNPAGHPDPRYATHDFYVDDSPEALFTRKTIQQEMFVPTSFTMWLAERSLKGEDY